MSEWVQARAAGHAGDPAEAYRRGHEEGYAEGERVGMVQGRRAGMVTGMRVGGHVGILLDCLVREEGRAYNPGLISGKLMEHEELRELAWATARMFGKEDEFRRYIRRQARMAR